MAASFSAGRCHLAVQEPDAAGRPARPPAGARTPRSPSAPRPGRSRRPAGRRRRPGGRPPPRGAPAPRRPARREVDGSHSWSPARAPAAARRARVRSRSPKMTMAAVRGIGVAVMTSRSGSRLAVPSALQRGALLDPEAVLLVDHHHAERREPHLVGQQGMGADHDRRCRRPARSASIWAACRCRLTRPVSNSTRTSSVEPEHLADGHGVLLGQHLGGHHERPWCPLCTATEQRGQRHHGLARSDVALEQAVHGERAGQIGDDHRQRPPLGRGQLEGQRRRGTAADEGAADGTGDLARRHSWRMPGRCARTPAGAAPGPAAGGTARRRPAGAGPARSHRATRGRGWPAWPPCGPTDPSAVAPRLGAAGRRTSPARSSASSTNVPISQLVSPAFAEAG